MIINYSWFENRPLTEEDNWKIDYLQKRERSSPNTIFPPLEPGDPGGARVAYELMQSRKPPEHLKLIKAQMQNAWRQYVKREKDKKDGLRQHTFTLEEKTMSELKRLARRGGMGLNETLKHIIHETYQIVSPPKKRAPRSNPPLTPNHY